MEFFGIYDHPGPMTNRAWRSATKQGLARCLTPEIRVRRSFQRTLGRLEQLSLHHLCGDEVQSVHVLDGEINVRNVDLELVLDEDAQVGHAERIDEPASYQRLIITQGIRTVTQELSNRKGSQLVPHLSWLSSGHVGGGMGRRDPFNGPLLAVQLEKLSAILRAAPSFRWMSC